MPVPFQALNHSSLLLTDIEVLGIYGNFSGV